VRGGFARAALSGFDLRKRGVRKRVARIDRDRALEVRERGGDLPARHQQRAELELRLGDAGLDAHRLGEVGQRLGGVPLAPVVRADAPMRDEVVGCHRQRVLEQRERVAPDLHLAERRDRERRDHRERRDAQRAPRQRRARPAQQRVAQVHGAPRSDDREPDLRHVRVPVRAHVHAELDEPEHGDERAEEPEPADREVAMPRRAQHRDRDGERADRRRRRRTDRRDVERVRVVDGEPARPDRLRDVERDRDERLRGAHGEPHLGPRLRRRTALVDQRHRDRCRADREQRPLLERRARDPPGIGRASAVRPQPRERPIIEQEQRERQRHDHRLGQQTCGEARGHRGEPPAARLLRIARVREHREHPEQPGERVLALERPRHRLDVQRMHGEHGRDERAAPVRARHPREREEQQRRTGRVQRDVHPERSGRTGPEQRPVHLERDVGERDEVAEMGPREHAHHALGAPARRDVGIRRDVLGVVEVDEFVRADFRVDRNRQRDQRQRDLRPLAHGRTIAGARLSPAQREPGQSERQEQHRARLRHDRDLEAEPIDAVIVAARHAPERRRVLLHDLGRRLRQIHDSEQIRWTRGRPRQRIRRPLRNVEVRVRQRIGRALRSAGVGLCVRGRIRQRDLERRSGDGRMDRGRRIDLDRAERDVGTRRRVEGRARGEGRGGNG
jgi:hypothetical protein